MPAWLDKGEIRRAIAVLVEPGAVFEIRVLGGRKRQGDDWRSNFFGYFDAAEPAIAALADLRGGWQGAYLTPNPCLPELLARVCNRLERGREGDGCKDGEILRRRWLLVDVDAQRVKGIAATAGEHAAAHAKAAQVAAMLGGAGFGDPILADSGNGAHLLWRVDLPARDETIPRLLKALALRFNDPDGESKYVTPAGEPRVCVDASVGNPARIWKLYGTLAAKGEHTGDRPHRMAKILSVPAQLAPVPAGLLQALAPEPEPKAERPRLRLAGTAPAGGAFDALAFVEAAGLEPKAGKRLDDGGTLHELRACPCPRREAKSFLTLAASGAVGLACQNATCAYSRAAGSPGDHWRTFRSEHDPDYAAGLDGERQAAADAVAAWQRDVWSRRRARPLPALPPVVHGAIDGAAFVGAAPSSETTAGVFEVDKRCIVWPVADNKGKPRGGYIENTQALLQAYGVKARYNLMAHETEITGDGWQVPGEVARNYGIASIRIAGERHGLKKDSVTEHLTVLAAPYHPVRDWLAGAEHDGQDRIEALFDTITLRADADRYLCRTLFEFWLRQCAAAALLPDGEFRASGVLVAQGAQNRGKTRWLEALAPPEHRAAWIATGVALDPHDRDSIQQLTGYWIAELGEIEATFRRDVAMLKAMITRPFDVYRQAYARAAERVPRRTVFYGSVNRPDYLIDDTGNRRFWTLPVDSMDADHGIDVRQLWAQVAHDVLAGKRYWLTQDESDALEVANAQFKASDPLALELWATWAPIPLEAADAGDAGGKTVSEIWAAMPSGNGGRPPDRATAGRLGVLLAGCRRQQVRHGNATFRVKLIAEPAERPAYGYGYNSRRYGDD